VRKRQCDVPRYLDEEKSTHALNYRHGAGKIAIQTRKNGRKKRRKAFAVVRLSSMHANVRRHRAGKSLGNLLTAPETGFLES